MTKRMQQEDSILKRWMEKENKTITKSLYLNYMRKFEFTWDICKCRPNHGALQYLNQDFMQETNEDV